MLGGEGGIQGRGGDGGAFCLFGLFVCLFIYLLACFVELGRGDGEMEMGDGLKGLFAWREECFLRGNFGLGCRSTVWRGDSLTACVHMHMCVGRRAECMQWRRRLRSC